MRFAHAPLSVLLVGLFATRAAVAADDELSLDLATSTALVVRKVPKGSFVEGSPTNEPQREADEAARKVTITKPFWLGRTLVTRSQFSLFASETRHITDAEKGQSGGFGIDARSGALVNRREFNWRNPGFVQRDDDPVVLVSFGDASAFVAWASRKTNRRVRLPTEAEWEYAARAGTTTPWFAAASEVEALQIGWFRLSASGTTHPVATRRPNAFGLFDMAGNVQEWCRDVYAPYPAGEAVDPETTTSAETERRVLRGGSWLKDPRRGRSAARNKGVPSSRSAENGFRVAVEDDPTATASSAALVPPTPAAPDADAGPTSLLTSAAQRSEGGSTWSLWLAPLAAAALSVGWVLARRGARRSPRVASSTLRMPRPVDRPPAVVTTPVPRVSEPPPSPRVSMPPRVSITPQPVAPAPLPASTQRMASAPPPPASAPEPSAPIALPSDALPLSLPPSQIVPPPSSGMTGPPPPAPPPLDALAQPPPPPFPLAVSMLPPPSSSMTGPPSPPSPPSSSMTGPPSPRDSVPAAPLATLLAALSSRPLLPPAVVELPEPAADPDVTAPYPALSSSVLVEDPDVTAPLKAIPPEQPLPEPPSDEGPPRSRT